MTADSVIDEIAGVVIVPPDGGFGWVIVAASFFCNAIVDGIIFTAGQAFQPEWEAHFGVSSAASAWVVSLLSGCYLLAGPVVSALVNIFGCRKTVLFGTLVAAAGFGLSIVSPSISVLYLTFGVLGGLGFGLIYLPSIVVVGYYFEKRRALATGIAVCGSGIGTFVFAPITRLLLNEYSWDQVLLIFTGFILNCAVFGALYRTLQPNRSQIDKFVKNMPLLERMSEEQQAVITASTDSFKASNRCYSTGALRAATSKGKLGTDAMLTVSKEGLHVLNRPMSRQDIFYTGSTRNLTEFKSQPVVSQYIASTLNLDTIPTADLPDGKISTESAMKATLRVMLDLSILKSPSFVILALSGFFTLTGFFVPFIYLPRQAQLVGHDLDSSTLLVSILGITNIVARVLCGWLSDRPQVNALLVNNVALTIAGLATMLVPHLEAYWLLCSYCVVFGFGTACFASLRSIICVELLGLEKLTNAFGLCLLFMGVASLVGSPTAGLITGFLYDITGNFRLSFYITGGLIALSGLIGFPLQFVNNWEKSRQKPLADNNDGGETSVAQNGGTKGSDGDIKEKVALIAKTPRAQAPTVTATVIEEEDMPTVV